MALAGLRQRALQGDRVSLETLIARPPAILLRSDYRAGPIFGRRSAGCPIRWRAGRAVRGRWRPTAAAGPAWGPLLIDEIERLRRELGR